jgi:RNA polymerase sigma-B factor
MAWERVVSVHAGPTSGRTLHERFVEYRRTGDRRIRDELVEAHVGLATYLARRFFGRGEPIDDLRQVALGGLLKAVERFEPERGLKFSTFATPTILGELKRHFRDRGWAIHVPRRVQELHLRIGATISAFSQEDGRSPTPTEIAQTTETPIDEVVEAIAVGDLYRLQSLDAPTSGDSDDSPATGDAVSDREEGFARVEDQELLATLVNRLPSREQHIIYLRFFEERTQREIAAELGISQMQVSRLLAQSLATLHQEASA